VTKGVIHPPFDPRWSNRWSTEYLTDEQIIPMSEADMDLPPDPSIVAALQERLSAPLGYAPPYTHSGVARTLSAYYAHRYGFEIDVENFWLYSGTVPATHLMMEAIAGAGDEVIYFSPSYKAIPSAIRSAGAIAKPLDIRPSDTAAIDVDALRAMVTARTRAIYLCNPHNPTGHSFRPPELRAIATLASDANLVILSNELHSRVTLRGSHVPIATLDDETSSRTITLAGASKSHNVAALGGGFAFSSNGDLISRLKAGVGHRLGAARPLQQAVLDAAYREDSPWIRSTRNIIARNQRRLAGFLAENFPRIEFIPGDATYFAWLNFERLAIAAADDVRRHCRVAGLSGGDFGASDSHLRLTLATTDEIMTEVLDRLRDGLPRLVRH
jgi:cysteine-S-conjugate beta-lyase